MALKKVADLVLKTPGGSYRTVGGLLQDDRNDDKKGPGYSIALDRHFSPSGTHDDGTGTVFLSCYWAKGHGPQSTPNPVPRDVRRPPGTPLDPGDIPF